MKLQSSKSKLQGRDLGPGCSQQRGVSLIECLVYIAVLGVVVTTALLGFNRCWDNSKRLRHDADDIVRALHAGEQWRADIRAAAGEIRVVEQDGGEQVVIPQRRGQVIYICGKGALRRQAGAAARAIVVLENVHSSQMRSEPRRHVTTWQWELALVPGQKDARMLPLFTFETVAGNDHPQ